MTFRNLTQGNLVHILIKGEPMEYKEGIIVSVGAPRVEVPSFNPNQFPMQNKPATLVVDITYSVGDKNITEFNLPFEKEHYYNKCALYVTMCMIDSDSCNTIISIMGSSEVSTRYSDEYFKNVYKLALDKLTDKDGMFCIREYFRL